MGAIGQLGLVRVAGLVGAVALMVVAFWLLWAARARADDQRRVVLPVLGRVGNPTCLMLGVCCFVGAYHTAAYSLGPVVALVSVPIDLWWVVVGGIALAVVGALVAERVEQRDGEA